MLWTNLSWLTLVNNCQVSCILMKGLVEGKSVIKNLLHNIWLSLFELNWRNAFTCKCYFNICGCTYNAIVMSKRKAKRKKKVLWNYIQVYIFTAGSEGQMKRAAADASLLIEQEEEFRTSKQRKWSVSPTMWEHPSLNPNPDAEVVHTHQRWRKGLVLIHFLLLQTAMTVTSFALTRRSFSSGHISKIKAAALFTLVKAS